MNFDVYAKVDDVIDNSKPADKDSLIYKDVPHSHTSEQPTKLEQLLCRRCLIESADKSIEQRLLDIQAKPQVQLFDQNTNSMKTHEVSRIIIQRGFLQDPIGTQIEYKVI